MQISQLEINIANVGNDFLEFLPRLIGAAVISVFGFGVLVVAPLVIWINVVRPKITARPVLMFLTFVVYCWVVAAGLVVLSLVINTLSIDPLVTAVNAFARTVGFFFVPILLVIAGVAYVRTSSAAEDASIGDSAPSGHA